MHIGERIRARRNERGVSCEQLAQQIGRRVGTVFKWEWGKTSPRYEDLEAVAGALGIDIHDLLPPSKRRAKGKAA